MKKIRYILVSVVVALIILKYLFPSTDIKTRIENLRQKTAPSLDSFNNKLTAENRFFDSIQHLISSHKLNEAENIINKLLKQQPKNDYYLTLKGEVFDARSQFDSAIYYFDYAIMINPNSDGMIEKAKSFIKTKHYSEAIEIYKKAYHQNYDFSYQLAQIFELTKQKDSAIKYYKIYVMHYPDSNLKKRIEILEKNL